MYLAHLLCRTARTPFDRHRRPAQLPKALLVEPSVTSRGMPPSTPGSFIHPFTTVKVTSTSQHAAALCAVHLQSRRYVAFPTERTGQWVRSTVVPGPVTFLDTVAPQRSSTEQGTYLVAVEPR
jgi:hypothetical protein